MFMNWLPPQKRNRPADQEFTLLYGPVISDVHTVQRKKSDLHLDCFQERMSIMQFFGVSVKIRINMIKRL